MFFIRFIMSTKLILAGALAIAATLLFAASFDNGLNTEAQDLADFKAFLQKYRKTLSSPEDFEFRLRVFTDNKRYAESVNAQGLSYKLGENEFSDLTFEEFSRKFLSAPKYQSLERPQANPHFKLSGSKNWLAEGKVTPVKNQGACGSCWAFSTTGSLETAHAIKTGELIGYSESELVDCAGDYGNEGCNGGEMRDAFHYIKDHQLSPEKDYPYVPKTRECTADKTKNNRIKIKSYEILKNPVVEELVKLIDINTVSIGIEVQRDFQMYKSGIFKGKPNCGWRLNHGVLAVGYDTDKETALDYFLVKNSWGKGWGEEGYVRVLVGTGAGTCGVASTDDVYPVVE